PARRRRAPAPDHQPLGLRPLHGLFREGPCHLGGRQQGLCDRDRSEGCTVESMTSQLRLPAEWEPQAGGLLAGPHAGNDWNESLPEVESTYLALVAAITQFESAVVCVADAEVRE